MIDLTNPGQLSGFIAGAIGLWRIIVKWQKWWDAKIEREEEEIRGIDAEAYRKSISADPILVSASAWAALREDIQRLDATIEAFRDSEERLAMGHARLEQRHERLAASHARLETAVGIIEDRIGPNA